MVLSRAADDKANAWPKPGMVSEPGFVQGKPTYPDLPAQCGRQLAHLFTQGLTIPGWRQCRLPCRCMPCRQGTWQSNAKRIHFCRCFGAAASRRRLQIFAAESHRSRRPALTALTSPENISGAHAAPAVRVVVAGLRRKDCQRARGRRKSLPWAWEFDEFSCARSSKGGPAN